MMFTWNRLEYTKRALPCLLDSLHQYGPARSHLILVENASVDGTREFVEQTVAEHPDFHITLLQNRRPRIVAANMVQALRHCTAPYIGKIDNDVLTPPGWIAALKQRLDAFPELALVGGRAHSRHGELLVQRDGIGYYKVRNVGGNFLAWAEPLQQIPIPVPRLPWFVRGNRRFRGFTQWQWSLPERSSGPTTIGWAWPNVPFRPMDAHHFPDRKTDYYARKGWSRHPVYRGTDIQRDPENQNANEYNELSPRDD